jgi:branched-chain amino acid transport system substrate-binding protein
MKKILVLSLIVAIGLTFLIGCSSKEEGSIKIGVLLPLTGSQAKFGEMEKNSFDIAQAEINQAGGIKGRQLEFVYEDDTGKPDVGRMGMEKLIAQDKVPMITGGYSSSVTFAAAQVAQKYRVPFMVCTGSVDKITEPEAYDLNKNDGDKFYVYRINPPVSEYASGLEGFINSVVKPKSVMIFHEGTTFGTKGAEAFAKTCSKLGIDVLGTESYTEGTVDFKPMLLGVKEKNPDVVYMIAYVMDAALLMKQSKDLQLSPQIFIGAGAGFTMPAFRENAGVASRKVVSSTLWHQSLPLAGAQEYFDKYVEKFGAENTPDYHGAEAYAAAYVVKDVLNRATDYTPESLKNALDKSDLMTVFGPVKFTSYGKKIHQNKMDTYVVQWINDELKLIWPQSLADADYAFPINYAKEWAE